MTSEPPHRREPQPLDGTAPRREGRGGGPRRPHRIARRTDPEVWRYAFEHDQIAVTINAADFIRLAESVELHPGLIVLRALGGLSRDEQWAWVEPVVDWLLATGESLVNKAVVVSGAGKFVCVGLPPEQ